MSEFEDPILRDRLSRYAAEPLDGDAGYAGVQQRIRKVKRRRIGIWSGAIVVVIGVGSANALRAPDDAKVTVPTASTPVTRLPTTSTSTTSTSTPATSTPATSTTVATSAAATTALATAEPVTEITNPETAAGNPDSGNVAAAGGAPTRPAPTAPAAAAVEGEERHRSATGGTVRVRLVSGSLSLVSAIPNDGFEARVDEETASRIRIVFNGRASSSVVTATLIEGEIRFHVRERGGDQDDSSATSVEDNRDDRDGEHRDHGDWRNRGDGSDARWDGGGD
ncbi:MAG: hypothetical protein ABWZ99_04435 [Ilumatobacteraceae bacterium]